LSHRDTGLPEYLATEVGQLLDDFTVLYDSLYPKDDGDYSSLMKEYFKAHASDDLRKRLKQKGWKM